MPIADHDAYITDPNRPRSLFSKFFLGPKFMFYPQIFWIVWTNSRKAVRGVYSSEEWARSSLDVLQVLERIGLSVEITGMNHFTKIAGPVVFIGNHMSTLETFVLPCIIQPVKNTTFVVKKSLVEMPVFGPVMRSREPIVVERKNPREDLKKVLEEGKQKLHAGISLIIFPQNTRSVAFVPSDFNSLGIKLAIKAEVPVVPIALKTDAWGVGKYLKDFGPIDKKKKVHLAFGEPIHIEGSGKTEHQRIIHFIESKLKKWKVEDAS